MLIRNPKAWCAAGAMLTFAGAAYAQVIPIQPGMWEITSRMTSMTGMPPQMQGIMGRPRTFRNCLTAEEAREGIQSVLKREADGKCSFTKFSAAGGRFSHELTCTGRGAMVMTANGTYTPTSYTGSSRMVMDGGKMIITGTASGRWAGQCRR